MLIKNNINIKLKYLIDVYDSKALSENNNKTLESMLNNLVDKYNHNDHFIDSILIKLVVKKDFIYKGELNLRDIHYTYEFHKILFLRKLLIKENKKYENKEITVCLINDDKDNIDLHKIEDYTLSSLMYETNKINNHKNFENSFKKEKLFYVKNTRESIVNTLYANNKKKILRQNSEDKFTEFKKIRDTIEYKYLNVICPICHATYEKLINSEKENLKLHKFEINEDTIDEIIHIEKNIQRISFNCLHEDMKISTSKFYIKADDFNINLEKEEKRKVQIWFLKNLKYLAKMVLNEAS